MSTKCHSVKILRNSGPLNNFWQLMNITVLHQ